MRRDLEQRMSCFFLVLFLILFLLWMTDREKRKREKEEEDFINIKSLPNLAVGQGLNGGWEFAKLSFPCWH